MSYSKELACSRKCSLLDSLQFDVINTLSDQLLEDVRVAVEPAEGFKVVREVPISKLPYGETGHCYVLLQYPDDVGSSVGEFFPAVYCVI